MNAAQAPAKRYERLSVAATRVGVSVRTLRRWAAEGLLRVFRPGGPKGKRLVSTEELDGLIEASASKADAK